MQVLAISDYKRAPNKDTVTLLRSALERAERGEMQDVILIEMHGLAPPDCFLAGKAKEDTKRASGVLFVLANELLWRA